VKKLLFGGILALVAVGLISAKGNGEGLEVSGAVSTGLRLDIVGGEDDKVPAKMMTQDILILLRTELFGRRHLVCGMMMLVTDLL